MSFDKGHALIIGIGTYTNAPQMNVASTVADAQAVASVLQNPKYCSYPAQQVHLLNDGTATRDHMLTVLEDLASQIGEDDTLFLFYSGHGHYGSDGNYYLTSHDTQFSSGQVVPSTSISQQELLERLRAIKAKRMLLIFNACHAGVISPVLGADEELFTGTPLPSQTAAALLATGTGRVIITACRQDQVAFVGDGPLTLFAQALVDGLQGKGIDIINRQGFISAFDLYTHAYDTLGDWVPPAYPGTGPAVLW